MKIWAKTEEFKEGKFLVIRRDGSIPAWPHFVLGARDPAAPAALRAYAEAYRNQCCALADGADEGKFDREYYDSILELAGDFERYREAEGPGDADAPPHRKDERSVIKAMRRQMSKSGYAMIVVHADQGNVRKGEPK